MKETMSQQPADQPKSFCDPQVIAIFPVRYALTKDKLGQIAAGATSIAVPQNKDNLRDHELRRIRAGYVYIYGDNDTWRVYRYLADPSTDENSTLDFEDSERKAGARQKFYEINWSNGAGSIWRAVSNPASYLTVSSTVSKIWIAYSEERWPFHMLELLENHASLRAKVMQEINLTAEDTPHSFKLDQLPQKVAEFRSSAARNPVENQMRYTQLQAEQVSRLDPLCERNKETARAVVLRDDLGELLDVGALHVQLAATIQRFAQEHYYATSMADCVDLIRTDVNNTQDKWYKYFSTHPLNPQFDTLRRQIRTEMAAQERRSAGMIGLMATIFARDGNFSPIAEIGVAMNGISAIRDKRSAEAWAYCWFLLGRSWQYTAVTATGNTVMGKVFDDQGPGKTSDWLKVMTSLLDASNKGSYAFEIRTLRHFNFAVSSQAYVMAQRWTRSPAGIFFIESFAKPHGRVVTMRTVPASNVAAVIREQFASMNVPTRGGSFDAATGHFASARTHLLNIPVVEGGASINMTNSGQSHFQALHVADNVLKGASLLLGLCTTYSALQQLSKPAGREATMLGSAVNNAKVQVISELVGLAAAITDIGKITSAANFGGIRAEGMRALFQNGARFNLAEIKVLNLQSTVNGSAVNISKFASFANAALMVGAAIAIGRSYEGWVRGDMNAALGNALVAAGSIVMLAVGSTGFGAVAGLVMIAVGTAITIFADDDLTKWLRGSFWGEGYYVYWDRDRIPDFNLQLQLSKALANRNSAMSGYYKQELEDFLDLIWGISVSNQAKGDKKVEIYCGAIQTPADVGKLTVTLGEVSQSSSFMGVPGPRSSIEVRGVSVDLQFIEPQRVLATFRNFTPREQSTTFGTTHYDTVDVTARYPKFGGGTWENVLTVSGFEL